MALAIAFFCGALDILRISNITLLYKKSNIKQLIV